MKFDDLEEAQGYATTLKSLEEIDHSRGITLTFSDVNGQKRAVLIGHPHSKDGMVRRNHQEILNAYNDVHEYPKLRLKALGVNS